MNARSPDTSADSNLEAATGKARALVLAAARGADDPMARAFGVRHKCLLNVGGVPMLRRVVEALRGAPEIGEVFIVIDDQQAACEALGELAGEIAFLPVAESAAASATQALQKLFAGSDAPVLVTTGDHALLKPEMVAAMFGAAHDNPRADLLVGLARREVVETAFPQVRRTWLRFGRDQATACNLFLFRHARAVAAAHFWRRAEQNRKQPWRIAFAFGLWPLMRLLLGMVLPAAGSLHRAFALASRRLGIVAQPVLLTDARAAIDVDKSDDLALVEKIVRQCEE